MSYPPFGVVRFQKDDLIEMLLPLQFLSPIRISLRLKQIQVYLLTLIGIRV